MDGINKTKDSLTRHSHICCRRCERVLLEVLVDTIAFTDIKLDFCVNED